MSDSSSATEKGSGRAIPFFDKHDLLVYLIPGAALILGTTWFEQWIHPRALEIRPDLVLRNPMGEAILLVPGLKGEDSAALVISYIFTFVIVAYILGHIISSIASLVLERVLLGRGYAYPIQYLLAKVVSSRPKKETATKGNAAQGGSVLPGKNVHNYYYRGMFFWTNVLVVVTYLNVVYRHPVFLFPAWTIFVTLVASAILRTWHKSSRSRAQKTRKPEGGPPLPSGGAPDGPGKDSKIIKLASDFTMYVLAGPYDLVASPTLKYLQLAKSYTSGFARKCDKLFTEKFKIDPAFAQIHDSEGLDLYWQIQCYVTTQSADASRKLERQNNMYSFARNLSGSLFLVFLYCVVLTYRYNLSPVLRVSEFRAAVPLLVLAAAWAMLLRFIFFYFGYSEYLFKCFVQLQSNGDKTSDLSEIDIRVRSTARPHDCKSRSKNPPQSGSGGGLNIGGIRAEANPGQDAGDQDDTPETESDDGTGGD